MSNKPIRERVGEAYEDETCQFCGYDGTHDRFSGTTKVGNLNSIRKWYDIVECGDCLKTIKRRGGHYDHHTGEIDDVEDLKWKYSDGISL